MTLLKPRKITARHRATSRANGRRSHGPKTPRGKRAVSLNALKHGLRSRTGARPLWQAMTAMGEDAERYPALLEEAVRSFPPGCALERALCEEITGLRLKLERNQRAQEAKLVRTFERLEQSRLKRRRELESGVGYDGPQAEVKEKGLLAAPDCPAKFTEVEACLERLEEHIENGWFSEETELEALYGAKPTFRGAGIINAFRALSEHPEDEELLASLRMMLHEEERDIAEARQSYLAEQVEITPALRMECLAPVGDAEYAALERREAILHQQLERKIKLLLAMQAARRKQVREQSLEQDQEQSPGQGKEQGHNQGNDGREDAVREPLGWIERASGARSRSSAVKGSAPAKASKAGKASHPAVKGGKTNGRGVSLQQKLTGPRRRERHGDMAEMVQRISEVYGLPPNRAESKGREQGAEPAPGPAKEAKSGAVRTRAVPDGSANGPASTARSGPSSDDASGASAATASAEKNGSESPASETTPPARKGEAGEAPRKAHDAPASPSRASAPWPPPPTPADYLRRRPIFTRSELDKLW